MFGLLIMVAISIFHEEVAKMFTSDPATADIIDGALVVLVLCNFFFNITGVQMGIIRGIAQ